MSVYTHTHTKGKVDADSSNPENYLFYLIKVVGEG